MKVVLILGLIFVCASVTFADKPHKKYSKDANDRKKDSSEERDFKAGNDDLPLKDSTDVDFRNLRTPFRYFLSFYSSFQKILYFFINFFI